MSVPARRHRPRTSRLWQGELRRIGRVAKHHIYLGEIIPVLWPLANAASFGA
jgi:hypothetical protein